MSEYKKVSSVKYLDNLDDNDVLAGYRSGLNLDPEPGSDRSRSFWHGWRNGMMDRGKLSHYAESCQLAKEYGLFVKECVIHSSAL